MIDLLTAWLLFPVALGAVALGLGLLVDRIAGLRVPGTLLPAIGVAAIIVIGGFVTLSPDTAELTTPVCVVAAIAGFVLSDRWRSPRVDGAAAAAAAGVFLVFAAPVVLSGEATFTGYIKLDDTATWLAFTDQVMERGRDLDGLAISTYERTLSVNLSESYPLGGFIPLGVGARATGVDTAWAFQPFMALLAAFMALALYELGRPLIGSRRATAAVAFVAAQSALLFGYVLWGGVKEIEMAMLLPALVAAAVLLERRRSAARDSGWDWASLRDTAPVAVLAAAVFGSLGYLGGVWLAPLLVPAVVFVYLSRGLRSTALLLAGVAALTALLSIPVILAGNSFTPTADSLRGDADLGNLGDPLKIAQVLGVWPAPDFRVEPVNELLGYSLAAVAGLLGLGGLVLAFLRRRSGLVTYAAGGLVALGLILWKGSPWVDGKAMATISPAILLLAGAAAVNLIYSREYRALGAVAAFSVVAGVAWSNVLAFGDASVAPREQLAELGEIGEDIAGDGPTLMTEYQPYGARYFLRKADPEAASELRHRTVPLRDGSSLEPGAFADTDQFDPSGILVYRTLVLRRSPVQSRPPAVYRLVEKGDYYTVWQRPPGPAGIVLEHLPLGDSVDPGAVPKCSEVRRLGQLAGPEGVLAAVPRAPTAAINAAQLLAPAGWRRAGDAVYLYPEFDSVAGGQMAIPAGGRLEAWIGGSLHGDLALWVGREPVGEASYQRNNLGQYVHIGDIDIEAGRHVVGLTFDRSSLAPGQAAAAEGLGPLILAREDIDNPVRYVSAAQATALCGKRWDWIEAIP